MKPQLSIVIPNWNGEAFLSRCVASIVQSSRSAGATHEIILVDDASSDRSCEIVEKNFPALKVLRNPQNLGFGGTANRGITESKGDIIVLLNNDLVAKEAMIAELLSPLLAQKDIFGVSGKTVNWHNEEPNHVCMMARWNRGAFELHHENSNTARDTMFVQGGSCAFRREEFIRLGMFHHLFSPGYWEDYDISYLALKAGWRNLYNPAALGYHLGQGSMRRAFGGFLDVIRARNRHLFAWLNVTDERMLKEHCFAAPRLLSAEMRAAMDGNYVARGFVRALKHIPEVSAERRRRRALIKHTDAEVLDRFR